MKCLNCGNDIKKNYKFCSRSCSITFNNKLRNPKKTCLYCNKVLSKSVKTYCSHECHFLHRTSLKLQNNIYVPDRTIKLYLLKLNGNRCLCCGISSWMGSNISMELHHIDGDHTNTSIDNVTLLCPNCHSQTPNYKAKNKGNGRKFRV